MKESPHYLIVGNGRVASHFQYYFSLLGLSFGVWSRKNSLEELAAHLGKASHILLLISDQAIEKFVTQHLSNSQALRVHFSGSLVTEHAYGAHPLMTFNHNLYSLEQYKTIPFIVDHDAPDFKELLPGLPNTHVQLDKSLKPKYHALCVMANNFSCILWQKLFSDFKQEFNFMPAMAFPCLLQQTQNLITDYEHALTGPLVRNDINTIEKNLAALYDDPFQKVYQSFVTCYQQLKNECLT